MDHIVDFRFFKKDEYLLDAWAPSSTSSYSPSAKVISWLVITCSHRCTFILLRTNVYCFVRCIMCTVYQWRFFQNNLSIDDLYPRSNSPTKNQVLVEGESERDKAYITNPALDSLRTRESKSSNFRWEFFFLTSSSIVSTLLTISLPSFKSYFRLFLVYLLSHSDASTGFEAVGFSTTFVESPLFILSCATTMSSLLTRAAPIWGRKWNYIVRTSEWDRLFQLTGTFMIGWWLLIIIMTLVNNLKL